MKHKVGDQMYVNGSIHISNGSADTIGGLATIKEIKIKDTGNPVNNIMVSFEELPGHSYNYTLLLEKQEELKERYGNQIAVSDFYIARPDPDIDTPWIEEGDIVNGQVYKGPPIW